MRATTQRLKRDPGETRGRQSSPNGDPDRAAQSLWLDAGEPDHLAPFFRFVGDQFAERGRRARQQHAAEIDETGRELRIGKPGVDRFVEYLDNLDRRVA